MAEYVGAIDQGTTSSRFILFDRDGRIVQVDQREHEQITPRAGWVEHDPKEVWRRTREVIGGALASSGCEAGDIAAIGITNQRETTVVWDRSTGEPVYNAIVWQDTRTGSLVREFQHGGHRPARQVQSGLGRIALLLVAYERNQSGIELRSLDLLRARGKLADAEVVHHYHDDVWAFDGSGAREQRSSAGG